MRTKWFLIGGAVILVAIVAYFMLTKNVIGMATTDFAVNASDLIGTKTGTTTAGVGFTIASTGGQSASTTYPVKTGPQVSEALFTIHFKNASSTSNFQITPLISNDDFCATATTSSGSGYDVVTTGQVNWFDAAPFLDGHAAQSLAVGTSTVVIANPVAGTGRTLLLTNLVSECVALQVSGSSTLVWSQVRVK